METLTDRALCSVLDVKFYLDIDFSETTYDEIIKRLINAATDDIYRLTGRDFSGATETRTYEVWESGLGSNVLAIHDAASVTAVTVSDESGNERDLTFDDDVDLLPRHRRSWEPITMIRVRNLGDLRDSDVVAVTANYGWPSIPEAIRQAAILTVAQWFARDVRKFSDTFVEEAGGDTVQLPRAFSLAVMDTLRLYARPVVR